MIGTIIDGEYRVDQALGEGAFGVVYRCHDLQLDRTVAIKLLRGVSRDPGEMKRVLREGRILASLNHPNVVQIHRLGSYEDTPYIVMECLSGRPLREILGGPRVSLAEGLGIMEQVAAGLAAIHARGIIHRDLSANNIMVGDDGTTKILDLGLARDLQTLSSASHGGYFVGTAAYVAPELIESRTTTQASDVFSFGILLYEVLADRHPFHAEHHMSMFYNIAHREPPPIERFIQDPPADLVRLIRDCLEKRPEDRPQGMEQIETRIRELRNLPSPDTVPLPVAAPTERMSSSTPSNPYLNRTMIRHREDFFGRSRDVRRIYARLNATPPGSVSVVGERRIGKSSLLNFIYQRAIREEYLVQPEKMVMVFVDLQEEKNMSIGSFVQILLRLTSLELRDRLDVSDCTHDLDGVRCLVERLHDHGFCMAILLDEFESITSNPSFNLEFFSFLRYLANHYNVAYITSSARDLQSLCHTQEISDSPFFNIFSTMKLSVFLEEEAGDLIRIPSERVGRPLAPHADKILELAGLFPFFLQIACSHTLDYLEENPDRDAPDFREIGRRFYEEARLHYRYIWDNLDSHERSAVKRVARRRTVSAAFLHVLQDLERRSLITTGDDSPRLFSRSFEEFISREIIEKGKPSLWGRILGKK